MNIEDMTVREQAQRRYDSRLEDLKRLWEAYCEGEEEVEDLGNIYDYGLDFSYVAPETFSDQKHGYFRYQLSYGGPTEEFRFFVDRDMRVYKIEFWLLVWFDGAHVLLTGKDYNFMEEIFEWFSEMGCVEYEYEQAMM